MGKAISDELSIQYLLSAPLLEEEVREIENLYFSDDAFLEHLQALELELNLRYLKNDLNPQERYLFENHFLLSGERRNTLEILRKLVPETETAAVKTADAPANGDTAGTASPDSVNPPSSHLKSLLVKLFPYGWTLPNGAFAAAAMAAVIIVGFLSVWTFSRGPRGAAEHSAKSEDPTTSQPAEVSQNRNQTYAPVNPQSKTNGPSITTENPPLQIAASDGASALSARQLFDRVRKAELDSFGGIRDLTSNPAAPAAPPAGPVGIRSRLFKLMPDGKEVQVDADQVFEPGDMIRLQVDVNTTGYLYIVAKGSSGKWSVLFPSASISQGRNRVRPSDRYQVPASSDGYFMFSGPSGTEKLYILLSRQPSNELDSLIYLTTDGNDADASRGVTERFDGGTFESTYKRLTSKDILTGVQEKAIYAVGGLKLVDGPVALELDLKHR